MKYIEQVLKIQRMAYTLNGLGRYTAFVDYAGHVKMLRVCVYKGEWENGKPPLFSTYTFAVEKWEDEFLQWFKDTGMQLQELIGEGDINE